MERILISKDLTQENALIFKIKLRDNGDMDSFLPYSFALLESKEEPEEILIDEIFPDEKKPISINMEKYLDMSETKEILKDYTEEIKEKEINIEYLIKTLFSKDTTEYNLTKALIESLN